MHFLTKLPKQKSYRELNYLSNKAKIILLRSIGFEVTTFKMYLRNSKSVISFKNYCNFNTLILRFLSLNNFKDVS